MIPTILAAAVGAFGTLPAPSSHANAFEMRATCIEVVLDVSETHFEAENFGVHDYVLVFGDADQGVLSHTVLRAGSSVSYDFQVGLLDGMFIEILSRKQNRWIASGALPLGELVEARHDSIWVQSAEKHLNAWIERPDGFDLWAAFGPLAPQSTHSRSTTKPTKSMHVPVVDPSDEPEEENPPVLEPKPLPPV